jgi:hypothetical protein
MRQFNEAFFQANLSRSREPRFAVKIYNDSGEFYFTSHDDITIAGDVTAGVLKNAGASSQKVTPEKGISTIGGMSFSVADNGVTDRLRTILAGNDTLINNKAELYVGYNELDFADYELLQTFWIESINSNEIDYSFVLKDTQRFMKRSAFNPVKTKLVQSFTSDEELTQLEVVDASNLERVEHDAGWTDAPSQTVGYIKVKGSRPDGLDTFEIMRYTGKSGNILTGITRAVLGSDRIEATGTIDGGSAEAEEFIYIDLPVPKLILAVISGDLEGQPGQTLPSGWHAGITADKFDLTSFQNIGNDLDSLRFAFYGLKTSQIKQWLADQLLFPNNLLLRVNPAGELELVRYSAVPQDSAPDTSLDETGIVSFSGINRNAQEIRNRFVINWEWRFDLEQYSRNNFYFDTDSQNRNNTISDFLSVNLRGVRNSGRDAQAVIDQIADGVSARYSNAAIRPTITAHGYDALGLEVGDLVRVSLSNWPDYANTNFLESTFEVQGTTIDFASGLVSLQLFGTDGIPAPIELQGGANPTLDHTGWTELTTALTGGTFTDVGGVLTITGNNTLVGAPTTSGGRYYYDGNIIIQTGVTLATTLNVIIDAVDISLQGTAKIDAEGQGYAGGAGQTIEDDYTGVIGTRGVFGGVDIAQEGSRAVTPLVGATKVRRHNYRNDNNRTTANHTGISDLKLSVDLSGNLVGLPETLMGNSGSGGAVAERQTSGGGDFFNAGGDGGDSGGGLMLICENLFTDAGSEINTSGLDGLAGVKGGTVGDYYGGSGGVGYPGALILLLKNRASPVPDISNLLIANAGDQIEAGDINDRPRSDGESEKFQSGDIYGPYRDLTLVNSIKNVNFWRTASLIKYISSEVEVEPTPGVDIPGYAELPTALTLTEDLNTPESPLGNLSTITMTATPPSDTLYSYAKFQYRLKGQDQWVDVEYGVRNESTFTVASDGAEYEVSAQSVSTSGVVSTGRVIESIVVSDINTQTVQDPASDETIQLPPIKRLELVNRLDDGEGWNQWKSPDVKLRWAALSLNHGGDIVNPGGTSDLILKSYKVTIKADDGAILREEEVIDSLYDYTFDKNVADGAGRSFRVEVTALATTGQHSEPVGINISNPAPDVPSNVVFNTGFTSIQINFDLPTNDQDFKGVNLYFVESPTDPLTTEPTLLLGNQVILDGLTTGATYSIVLESVDDFGIGGQTTEANIVTNKINAENLDDITGTITLDENGGRIITNNDGYIVVMGAVSRPSISSEPLILHAWDGVTSPFWVDAAGNAKFDGSATAMEFISGLISDQSGASFGDDGYQLGVFSGIPKFHVGVGEKKIQFDGVDFIVGKETELGNNAVLSVTVHQTTGDFASISDAIESLTKRIRGYKAGQEAAEIIIKDGYEESVGLDVLGMDLSWVSIKPDTGVTSYGVSGSWSAGNTIYTFTNSSSPRWFIVVDDTRISNINNRVFNVPSSQLNIDTSGMDAISSSGIFAFSETSSFIDINNIDVACSYDFLFIQSSILNFSNCDVRDHATTPTSNSGKISFSSCKVNGDTINMYATPGTAFVAFQAEGKLSSVNMRSAVSIYASFTGCHLRLQNFQQTGLGSYSSIGMKVDAGVIGITSCDFHKDGVTGDLATDIQITGGGIVQHHSITSNGGSNVTKNSAAALANGLNIGI